MGSIPVAGAKHAERRAFFVLARWVSHFAKLSERVKIWRVTAICTLRLSCSLKYDFNVLLCRNTLNYLEFYGTIIIHIHFERK